MTPTSRSVRWLAVLAVLLLVAACGGGDERTADPGADDPPVEGDADAAAEVGDAEAGAAAFEGETVTLVVPFSPGGGYDSYARMIAPYFAEELGAANVVVENQEGAGGLLAINSMTTDTSDGRRLAIMNAVGVAGATIAGAEGAAFALDDLAYVGRVGQESHLWATGADSEWESVEQVIEDGQFRFGSTGPGAADYVLSNLLIEIFDLEGSEIITGFEGSSENELAVTRLDVDGMTGDYDSRYPAVEDGDHRPLLVVGPERSEDLPDTPAIVDLDLDDTQQELVEPTLALLAMGRPIVAPPDISPDNLAFLREALERTLIREDLLEEAESTERPINYLSGAEMDELVQELLDAPPAFRETLVAAY